MNAGELGGAAQAALGLREVGLAARRVAAQREDVLDPGLGDPVEDRAPGPRVVSPTQLRWAIASSPCSRLIRSAISTVPSRVAPPAP